VPSSILFPPLAHPLCSKDWWIAMLCCNSRTDERLEIGGDGVRGGGWSQASLLREVQSFGVHRLAEEHPPTA